MSHMTELLTRVCTQCEQLQDAHTHLKFFLHFL